MPGPASRGGGQEKRPRILLKDPVMKKRASEVSGERRYPPVHPLDPHALYEVAVQGVEWDLDFLERVWRYAHPGREPKLFREDFCSTAALSTAWARRGPERRAWGV